MQVDLSADLLTSEESRLAMLGILALCAIGRHQVRAAPELRAWCQSLADPHLVDQIKLAIDDGESRAALGPPRSIINVAAEGGYSPDEALLLLGLPFRVLLENGRTDRDCLLAFADAATRRSLRDAEERGWLLFETAGGITEMQRRLDELVQTTWAKRRLFCVVDSDAKEPAGDDDEGVARSPEAQRVADTLVRLAAVIGLPADEVGKVGKVLDRRAIENYLPLSAFKRYLKGRLTPGAFNEVCALWQAAPADGWQPTAQQLGARGSERRALFAALALEEATAVVWTHVDVSEGRGDDGNRTAEVVWQQLSQRCQRALEHGFTKSMLRTFFARHTVGEQPAALPEPSGEIAGILAVIQERL